MSAQVKILCVLLWIIGIGTNPQAQLAAQSSILGYVLSAADSVPISGAHLTINNSVRATSQSPDGFFKISNAPIHSTLVISHVAYHSKRIEMNGRTMHIYLEPKIQLLPSVQISSKPYRNIIADKKMYLIDYAFVGEKLLAISLDNRKLKQAKVVLIDPQGDTTKSAPVEKPEELFKDCFQKFHLLETQTAYQLFIDDKQIRLIHPNPRALIEETFDIVKAYYQGKFLLHYHQMANQIVRISLYDTLSKKEKVICEIVDERGLERLSDKGRLQSMDGYTEDDARFEEMCFYAKKEVFAFLQDSFIFVFNSVDNKIQHYSLSGELVKEIPMNFHQQRHWDKTILRDEITKKYYTHFTRMGITTLYPINIENGNLGKAIPIPGLNFAQKIGVNNQTVYFLYNDRSNDNYKQLYAMHMK